MDVKQFFKKSEHKKYACWAVALVVAMIFVLIGRIIESKPKVIPKQNKTIIYVNAPESMQIAFTTTLIDTKLDKDYEIKFTDEVSKANFTVTEGLQDEGELIAYSPIIAVFNGSEELYNEYKEKEIFVQSEVSTSDNYIDFDFKKVIEEILSNPSSDFKVYYPSKTSNMWEEFYSFLLFTVNDGYYPKEGKDMQDVIKKVEDFLNSRNAEPINNSSLKIMNVFSKNSIYFMTYADLAHLNTTSNQNLYRIMYPKTVVYHNYYANFDENGKILYEALDKNGKGMFGYLHTGYTRLQHLYYNTRYSTGMPKRMNRNIMGARENFNGVEIPKTIYNNIKEEEQ